MAARSSPVAAPRAASACRPDADVAAAAARRSRFRELHAMTARLPRQARVRVRAEFDRTFKQGARAASPMLALHWLRDDAPARLGLAVSRKVDTRAVVRN